MLIETERSMASLFVGGIRDGDWFNVPDDYDMWNVRERPKLTTPSWPLPDKVDPSYIKQECYQRMKFRGIKHTYSVFGAQGMTPDDVLFALIQHYEPPDTKERDAERFSAVSRATIDAQLLGAGFLMITPDRKFEHIPAERLSLKPKEQPDNGDGCV